MRTFERWKLELYDWMLTGVCLFIPHCKLRLMIKRYKIDLRSRTFTLLCEELDESLNGRARRRINAKAK